MVPTVMAALDEEDAARASLEERLGRLADRFPDVEVHLVFRSGKVIATVFQAGPASRVSTFSGEDPGKVLTIALDDFEKVSDLNDGAPLGPEKS